MKYEGSKRMHREVRLVSWGTLAVILLVSCYSAYHYWVFKEGLILNSKLIPDHIMQQMKGQEWAALCVIGITFLISVVLHFKKYYIPSILLALTVLLSHRYLIDGLI